MRHVTPERVLRANRRVAGASLKKAKQIGEARRALKTETSRKPVPMDSALAAVLLDGRGRCPYNQNTDYVFASVEKHGKQPLWPSSAMSKHIRPVALQAGIAKHVRWHVFRHSFATLLKGNGEDVKPVQESLRHADSKVTLDTYTQGLMPVEEKHDGR